MKNRWFTIKEVCYYVSIITMQFFCTTNIYKNTKDWTADTVSQCQIH